MTQSSNQNLIRVAARILKKFDYDINGLNDSMVSGSHRDFDGGTEPNYELAAALRDKLIKHPGLAFEFEFFDEWSHVRITLQPEHECTAESSFDP